MNTNEVETTAERNHAEGKVERVAVVFTHGQGEQVPMQDVIALAESIWTQDDETARSKPEVSRDVWSVPVFDADMSEQRRLVTSTLRRGDQGRDDLQVDFYQFYWADLMTGNRFIHVWLWFRGLMDRKVCEVPPQLMVIRRAAMGIGLLVAAIGWVFGAVTLTRLLNANLLSWANFYALLLLFAMVFETRCLLYRAHRALAMMCGLGLILASLVLGALSLSLLHQECQFVELAQTGQGCEKASFNDWPAADAAVRAIGQSLGAAVAPWNINLASTVAVAHSLIAAAVIALAGAVSIAGYWLSKQFFVPVMADSARMLRGTPENIPARDRIRKRGMELMEALHHSERRYDRIVFLAHSLGTVVAYTVLMQYWGNVYRLFNHQASKAEREAAEAAAAAMSEASPGEGLAEARVVFRAKVRAYFAALCAPKSRLDPKDVEWRTTEYASNGQLLRTLLRNDRQRKPGALEEDSRSPWLVSDFITVGSPLTYGSLLMAGSDGEFQSNVKVRRFAVCPPSETTQGSFTHAERPHHAALFGVTCWTNIFFETEGLINGDIIGGKIGEAPPKGFGPGVLDVAVRSPRRGFVHNEYWLWRKEADGTPSEHIRALRSALHLFGHADAADAELKELAPPRTKPPALGAA